MAYHIDHNVYAYGDRELDTIRTFKEGARWCMGIIDPSFGEIPEWNENPEAFAAYEQVQATARELEKAYMNLLAVYERQELSDDRDNWAYADNRRSA